MPSTSGPEAAYHLASMSMLMDLRLNMVREIIRETRITTLPEVMSQISGTQLLERAYARLNPSIIRVSEEGEIFESDRLGTSMNNLEKEAGFYDETTIYNASGIDGEGVFRCELNFITDEELAGTKQEKLNILARAARISLSMANRVGGTLAKREDGLDLLLGNESGGYHHMPNKELSPAFLSVADLRRMATKEKIVFHVSETFGPTRYVIGTSPIRGIERKIRAKMQEISINLTGWTSNDSNFFFEIAQT